MSQADRRSRS